MKFFAKDFPEKLTSSILTSEVVGKTVKLKKHGKEFQGLCPFHNEKTPSFTVNDQKGFYHCFGCQEHGNIIDFLMKTQGLEFKDSVVTLAEDFGVTIPWQESKQRKSSTKIDRDRLLLQRICEIFEENLKSATGASARNYLEKRGFNLDIIDKFRLGFAPNSYDFLHQKLAQEGFSHQELLKSGIISKNNSGKLYDKFRNRVIFPILDKKNNPIAFGGRVLGDEMPKYLNSAETAIFKKSQTLYNFSNARRAIFAQKFAVIVEGYADVIALAAVGIENVVAGLGTALSSDHLIELFRITDRITLCLDGDGAGVNAAKRASQIALPLVNSVKNIDFVFLPNKLDPDDFVKKFGAKSLQKTLQKEAINFSQALFDFALMDLHIDEKTTIKPEEKAKIESDLTQKAELIKDPLTKKYFSQFFKDLLFKIGKNNNFSKKNGAKYQKNSQKMGDFVKIASSIKKNLAQSANKSDILVQNIIALLIKFPNLANYCDDNFDIKEIIFENEDLTEIKDQIIAKIEENNENDRENEKKSLLTLENYGQDNYIRGIRALIDGAFDNFSELSEGEINNKMRLLLLKNSLLQVATQYKQALSKIDEIDTHQTAVIDQKVKEIFACKNSLELEILALEKESI